MRFEWGFFFIFGKSFIFWCYSDWQPNRQVVFILWFCSWFSSSTLSNLLYFTCHTALRQSLQYLTKHMSIVQINITFKRHFCSILVLFSFPQLLFLKVYSKNVIKSSSAFCFYCISQAFFLALVTVLFFKSVLNFDVEFQCIHHLHSNKIK